MFRSTTLPRVLTGALVAAALAAPVAQSRPIDTPLAAAQPMDTHASVAESLAAKQDLRSPDARDAATRPRHQIATTQTRPLPGPPTWPEHPQAIAVRPEPTDGGSDVDWATIGLGIVGAVLAIGGIAALSRRTRRLQRVGV